MEGVVLGVEMEGSVPGTPPQVQSLSSSTDNSQASSITLFDDIHQQTHERSHLVPLLGPSAYYKDL